MKQWIIIKKFALKTLSKLVLIFLKLPTTTCKQISERSFSCSYHKCLWKNIICKKKKKKNATWPSCLRTGVRSCSTLVSIFILWSHKERNQNHKTSNSPGVYVGKQVGLSTLLEWNLKKMLRVSFYHYMISEMVIGPSDSGLYFTLCASRLKIRGNLALYAYLDCSNARKVTERLWCWVCIFSLCV